MPRRRSVTACGLLLLAAAATAAVMGRKRPKYAGEAASLRSAELQAARAQNYKRAAQLRSRRLGRVDVVLPALPAPPAAVPAKSVPQHPDGDCGAADCPSVLPVPDGAAPLSMLVVFVVAHHAIGSAAIRGDLIADALIDAVRRARASIDVAVHADAPTGHTGGPDVTRHNDTGLDAVLAGSQRAKVCWFVKDMRPGAVSACRSAGALVAWDALDNATSAKLRDPALEASVDLWVLQTEHAANRHRGAGHRTAVVRHHHTMMDAWRPDVAQGRDVALLAGHHENMPPLRTINSIAAAACSAGASSFVAVQQNGPPPGVSLLRWSCANPAAGPDCCSRKWPECRARPEWMCKLQHPQLPPVPPAPRPACPELRSAPNLGGSALQRQRGAHWFPGLRNVSVAVLWPPDTAEFTVRWRPVTRLLWWWAKGIPTVYYPYDAYTDAGAEYGYEVGGRQPAARTAEEAGDWIRVLLQSGRQRECLVRRGLTAAAHHSPLATAARISRMLHSQIQPQQAAPDTASLTFHVDAEASRMPPVNIRCDTGRIRILSATYGRGCPDVRENNLGECVAKACDGAVSCEIGDLVECVGDPAVQCPKPLDGAWTCGTSPPPTPAPPPAPPPPATQHHCSTRFVRYEPSEWEREWAAEIPTIAADFTCGGASESLLCRRVREDVGKGRAAGLRRQIGDGAGGLLSFLVFDKCGAESRVAVEPLVSFLRSPDCLCDPSRATRSCLLEKTWLLPAPPPATGRLFVVDVGASDFTGGAGGASLSWLVEKYGTGRKIDGIYAWEGSRKDPAAWWRQVPANLVHLVHFYNVFASTEPGGAHNPWRVISEFGAKEDHVVVKLDIDDPQKEMALIQQLLSDPSIVALVDELYWEHHVTGSPMRCPVMWCGGDVGCENGQGWINSPVLPENGRLDDSYRILTELRRKGVVAHSWV